MNTRIAQPLIISALVHACLVMLLLLTPMPPKKPELQNVQIVYQDETKKRQPPKQIINDVNPKLEKALKDLRQKVRFLSETTRRVLKQQVARRSGPKTVNGGAAAPGEPKLPNPFQHQVASPSKNSPQKSDDRPSITAPMQNVGSHGSMPESTIADYIPEIKEGGFTSLNENQFMFYTFYSRINEQIRNRWIENVRQIVNSLPQAALNKWSQAPQITQLEILLTPAGHFVRAILYRHAQSQALDEAAAGAFRLAAPFNNPPEELVGKDGYIHLYYEFHIEFRPGFLASGGSR